MLRVIHDDEFLELLVSRCELALVAARVLQSEAGGVSKCRVAQAFRSLSNGLSRWDVEVQ